MDETLVLEVLEPGTGQAFHHPDDAFHTRPDDQFVTSGRFDTIVVASEANKAEAEDALKKCSQARVVRVVNIANE